MRLLIAAASLVCVAVATAQQPDTARIAPVVITATRVPVTATSAPAAVTLIRGEDLRARGIVSIADALRDVPGVAFAQSGSFGGTTSLFLRGGESKYVKVLVDGVPVNDPGGAYDFGALTVDNVERIEVVRGPASVLYGADAVTGVIQIFTRRGGGLTRTTVSARGGTYGSADVDGTLRGAVGAGDYSVALARHDTHGIYEFNNAYHNTVVSGGVHVALDARTDLAASLRYTDFVFHYPTNGGGAVVDSNAMRLQDQTTVGIDLGRRFSPRVETHLTLSGYATSGGTDDASSPPSGSAFQSVDHIQRRSLDLRTNVAAATGTTATVGVAAEEQDQRSESQSVFGTFQSTSVFRATRNNRAAYAQLLSEPVSRLTLTAGARADHNEQFGSFGTYRVGASWGLLSHTRLRGSLGTAFREPGFFENFATGFVVGNKALHPERTQSWEVALMQRLADDRVTVSATQFGQRFRDMIDYTGSTKACGASYCNVARAEANGRELEASAVLVPELTVDANLTHLETRVLDPGFDTTSGGLYRRNEQLIRRPTTTWNAGAAYTHVRGRVDVHVSHVGARTDKDFRPFPAKPVTLPAYTLTDVSGELPLASYAPALPPITLTLRVANAFDTDYQSIFNFLSPRRTILLGGRVVF